MKTRRFAVMALVGAAACTHKAQVKSAAVPAPVQPAATASTAAPHPAAEVAPPRAVSPDLRASQALIEQCKLTLGSPAQAPKFDFDRFDLEPDDRAVLEQVAACVTTGPLAGRGLSLIGRADPRGTEEYNLGLGSRRAHTVAEYLERLGVTGTRLAETTRGALDATGSDEASWRVDRRVDLELAD